MNATAQAEANAVDLAEGYAEAALEALKADSPSVTVALRGVGLALLALGARTDALRETVNRELPDIGAAIFDASQQESS